MFKKVSDGKLWAIIQDQCKKYGIEIKKADKDHPAGIYITGEDGLYRDVTIQDVFPELYAREDAKPPDGYHWEKRETWKTSFQIGDLVESQCLDWDADNPMRVVGFVDDGSSVPALKCVGVSGKTYVEVPESWDIVNPEQHERSQLVEVDALVKDRTQSKYPEK